MKTFFTFIFCAFAFAAIGQTSHGPSGDNNRPTFTKDANGHLVRVGAFKPEKKLSNFQKLFNFEQMNTENMYKLTTSHMLSELKLHDLEGNEVPVKIISVGTSNERLGYLLEMSVPKGSYMFYAETNFEAWSTKIAIN